MAWALTSAQRPQPGAPTFLHSNSNHKGTTMEHTLPALPYALDALAPAYSQETM